MEVEKRFRKSSPVASESNPKLKIEILRRESQVKHINRIREAAKKRMQRCSIHTIRRPDYSTRTGKRCSTSEITVSQAESTTSKQRQRWHDRCCKVNDEQQKLKQNFEKLRNRQEKHMQKILYEAPLYDAYQLKHIERIRLESEKRQLYLAARYGLGFNKANQKISKQKESIKMQCGDNIDMKCNMSEKLSNFQDDNKANVNQHSDINHNNNHEKDIVIIRKTDKMPKACGKTQEEKCGKSKDMNSAENLKNGNPKRSEINKTKEANNLKNTNNSNCIIQLNKFKEIGCSPKVVYNDKNLPSDDIEKNLLTYEWLVKEDLLMGILKTVEESNELLQDSSESEQDKLKYSNLDHKETKDLSKRKCKLVEKSEKMESIITKSRLSTIVEDTVEDDNNVVLDLKPFQLNGEDKPSDFFTKSSDLETKTSSESISARTAMTTIKNKVQILQEEKSKNLNDIQQDSISEKSQNANKSTNNPELDSKYSKKSQNINKIEKSRQQSELRVNILAEEMSSERARCSLVELIKALNPTLRKLKKSAKKRIKKKSLSKKKIGI